MLVPRFWQRAEGTVSGPGGRPYRFAFGWVVDGSGLDGGALFSGTATRWVFE
jgi:hypothetical protein